MNATHLLHDLGQSIWLDTITRGMIADGTISRFISDYSVTGLTSNPTIFDKAIREGRQYDQAIREKSARGLGGEALFFELAIEDLTAAADLFRPTWDATDGRDGWVSLEVSPLLADDAAGTVSAARRLHGLAGRPNLFIKIPGTPAGVVAIEEAIFQGIPVNVTLLFSREQYVAAAEAYMRGLERRVAAGRDPRVQSVASLFISRWDQAVRDKVPPALRARLGIAVATLTYVSHQALLATPRWKRLAQAGARPQALLWASTGTKDPQSPDTLYVEALAAPNTINTMPEGTLRAFADHGVVRAGLSAGQGEEAARLMAEYTRAGVDTVALAGDLQEAGARSFVTSWNDLMLCVGETRARVGGPAQAG